MGSSKKKPFIFKEAVEATPDVALCYKPGLQALGMYSSLVVPADERGCGGSLDIDGCTAKKYPNDTRWDYALDYKGRTYFVEVHSAKTDEVKKMLRKLQWLKEWLHTKAPEINKLKAHDCFHWIQSGKFDILRNSPQLRIAATAGLRPKRKLHLK